MAAVIIFPQAQLGLCETPTRIADVSASIVILRFESNVNTTRLRAPRPNPTCLPRLRESAGWGPSLRLALPPWSDRDCPPLALRAAESALRFDAQFVHCPTQTVGLV